MDHFRDDHIKPVRIKIENNFNIILKYKLKQVMFRINGPRWLARYNDKLRFRLSGDRIPVGARYYATVQTGPGAHPASCTIGTGSFSRGQSGGGVALTNHYHLAPKLRKEQSFTFTPLMGLRGLFWGELNLSINFDISNSIKQTRIRREHYTPNYIWLNQLSNTTNLWQIYVYYIGINCMFRRLWPSSG